MSSKTPVNPDPPDMPKKSHVKRLKAERAPLAVEEYILISFPLTHREGMKNFEHGMLKHCGIDPATYNPAAEGGASPWMATADNAKVTYRVDVRGIPEPREDISAVRRALHQNEAMAIKRIGEMSGGNVKIYSDLLFKSRFNPSVQ